MNDVKLIGNVVEDVELKATKTGKSVARFRIGFVHSSTKNDDGTWNNQSSFCYVETWNWLADKCANLKKGERVLVAGKLKVEDYTTQNGTKGRNVVIIASAVEQILKIKKDAETSAFDDFGSGSSGFEGFDTGEVIPF